MIQRLYGHSGDDTREPVVVPSQLLYAIWSFVDYMAGYSQQDAHEFLIAFLNSLAAQLDGANDSSGANNFSEVRSVCDLDRSSHKRVNRNVTVYERCSRGLFNHSSAVLFAEKQALRMKASSISV